MDSNELEQIATGFLLKNEPCVTSTAPAVLVVQVMCSKLATRHTLLHIDGTEHV